MAPERVSPLVDPQLIGALNVFIFLLAFPSNLCLLWAIWKDRALWRLTAYQIIFHICSANSLLALSTLEIGLIALFHDLCVFPTSIITAGSIIAYFGPICLCMLSFLQALQRLAFFVRNVSLQFISRVLLWLVWPIMLAIVTTTILLGLTFGYNAHDFLFDFVDRLSLGIDQRLDYVVGGFILGGVGIYAILIGNIVILRGKVSKEEVKLSLQALIPFLYISLTRAAIVYSEDVLLKAEAIIVFSLIFRSLPGSSSSFTSFSTELFERPWTSKSSRKQRNPRFFQFSPRNLHRPQTPVDQRRRSTEIKSSHLLFWLIEWA